MVVGNGERDDRVGTSFGNRQLQFNEHVSNSRDILIGIDVDEVGRDDDAHARQHRHGGL
jgi:hypothetical protein